MAGFATRAKEGGEPVAVGGLVLAAIQSVLALLVGLGVFSTTVAGLLQGVVVALIPLFVIAVRARVTPTPL